MKSIPSSHLTIGDSECYNVRSGRQRKMIVFEDALFHRKYITAGKRVWTMSAGALFGLSFLAYAIVFIFVAALAVAACLIGIRWRKSKDAKVSSESGISAEGGRA